MKLNFPKCLSNVLKHEGGYVNNPKDPGGETNFGVTKAVARSYGYQGSMHNIPMALVQRVYRDGYWDKIDAEALPAGLDNAAFDYAVNSGPAKARTGLSKVSKLSTVPAIKRLCSDRLGFLQGLSTFRTFGKGWTRRVTAVEAQSIRMALEASGASQDSINAVMTREAKAATDKRTSDSGIAAGAVMVPAMSPAAGMPIWAYVVIGLVGAAVLSVIAWRAWVQTQRILAFQSKE